MKKVLYAMIVASLFVTACVSKRETEEPETSCWELMRHYQVLIRYDSTYVYDGTELIGAAPWSDDGRCAIDSVIMQTNY